MQFYSTRDKSLRADQRRAIMDGLAPDGGLYMPVEIPVLPDSFFKALPGMTLPEIGATVLGTFFGDGLSKAQIETMAADALNFPIPLVGIRERMATLELFHGPTMAFKDVGARCMARLLGTCVQQEDDHTYVLVATSGDTGSAVANGFHGVDGIRVIILYPSGKVSPVQEKQLTTLGGNVYALEVDGVFDDCQRMVKQVFSDPEMRKEFRLTSANSINVARFIPQSIYYFHGVGQMQGAEATVTIPSGNFGNLCAGLFAQRMGLNIRRFVAATNVNDVVPAYLQSGKYEPRASVATISNAMDVGAPSNFERILDLFDHDHARIAEVIHGYSFTDDETRSAIAKVFQEFNYLLDPHGAVGYLAMKKELADNGGMGFFLETAHPSKFPEVVEQATGLKVEIPERMQELMSREKKATRVPADEQALKDFMRALD
ncbi:MAG: threonine synthase [Flavobacteriales bacterium]|nr:threonine synthase [Flavobacteriales bacterium]MCB9448218.1 threonine synthase [Flavobacteriales bacterium]